MRKASAAIGVLFVVALTFAALSLPAGAQSTYPPVTTTPTTIPVTPTTQPPVTPTTQPPVTPTTGVTPTTAAATTTTTSAANAAANLAFTGSDSTPLVIVAIVAITLGAVLVVAARRRSSVRAPKV